MREDESNWFSKWEHDLPSPEDLMPLSQTLISPDLATAFDIRNPHLNHTPAPSFHPTSDSPQLGSGAKRPRLVWTPQLHKRFVDAVAHLGIKNAVPKTIMQHMCVDGLTRENVASHLQKYRLYLKRMQSGSVSGGDPATDHLFATAHFFHQNRSSSHHYVPVQQPHQHQQMPAAVVGQLQPPYGQIGHFGSPPNAQFQHSFLSRQNQQTIHRVITPIHNSVPSSYVDDLESPNGRKVLTLFPTGDD